MIDALGRKDNDHVPDRTSYMAYWGHMHTHISLSVRQDTIEGVPIMDTHVLLVVTGYRRLK